MPCAASDMGCVMCGNGVFHSAKAETESHVCATKSLQIIYRK